MREWLGFYLDAQVVNALISQGESCTLVEAERPVIGGNIFNDNNEVKETSELQHEGDILEHKFKAADPQDPHIGSNEFDTCSTPYQGLVHSDVEKRAAAVLLRAYRHRISRRRDTITKFRFSPELTRLFDRCLEEAQRMKWPSKHIFRKIYLGALPHILFCLEKALEGVTAAKSEVKERFNVAEHLELEELGKRQTELA